MPHPSLRLTPHAHLIFEDASDAPELDARVAARLAEAFSRGSGEGLLRLGAAEVGQALPPLFLWWRGFATRYVAALCLQSSAEAAALTDGELASLVLTAPMMPGAEYLTTDVLRALWAETGHSASPRRLPRRKSDLQSFPEGSESGLEPGRSGAFQSGGKPPRSGMRPSPSWRPTRRACPPRRKAQHVPLGQALREYAGAANRDKLLSLLLPVQRAAETLRLAQADDRCRRDLSSAALESARGLALPLQRARAGKRRRGRAHARRLARQPPAAPAGHRDGRRPPAIRGRARRAARFPHGRDAGRRAAHRRRRSQHCSPAPTDLVLLRGQWVEVDRERLERAMRQFREAEELAAARRPHLRRGDADAGRRRGRRGRRAMPPPPTGRA